MGRDLRLRRVDMADAETLFRWRNDPEARENSFQTQPIVYDEHIAWLDKTLRDSSQEIYILCEGDTPIGQVRLSTEDDAATVNYSIDAAHRAQGYGRVILQLVENLCVERGEPCALRGYVKKKNIASQIVFETLGYECGEMPDKNCLLYVKYKLQRSLVTEDKFAGGEHSS